jgi:transcriptional regulator with XRE-family HTH domain
VTTVQRWTGREARALRVALRLSVRGFAEHLGVAVRTVSKWEAGREATVPRPETQSILDTALGQCNRATQERFTLLCESANPPRTQPNWTNARLRTDSDVHIPDLIRHLQEMWHVLVRTDNLLGPRFALSGVLDQIAIIEELLPLASGSQRAELVTLAATYAESAAWLHEDSAQIPASAHWVGRATQWAHEVGDHKLLAWTLFRRSQHATAVRDPEGTLSLARAAGRGGDRLPAPMRAAIVQQEAHGHALKGDEVPAHRTLDRAIEWAATDDAGDSRNGHGSFCTSAYLELQRAMCWVALGRPERAIQLFNAVLPTLPAVYRRDRGVAFSRLAHAYATTGRPDEAAEAGRAALAIARASGSIRTEEVVAALARRLAGHRRVESVGSLLDELASLQ